MAKSIEKAVTWMEKLAKDDSHGYDQAHRNGPNYDCSSSIGTALNKAGFKVNPSSTTRNLYAQLKAEGFVSCKKPWKRGDIHLSVGHHVVMSTDANNIVHASINEKGKAIGGKSGDQTGKEICIRTYYEHSSGWDYHLRYKGNTPDKTDKKEKNNTSNKDYSNVLSGYKGDSIVDAFKSKNLDTSFSNRKKYAEKVGIKNYKGTGEQNAKLLKLLGAN